MKSPFGSHKTLGVITIFVLIAIAVCIICNFAIQKEMTWLIFPVLSLIFGWGVFLPLILKGKSGLILSLTLLTTLILPFLLILELWTRGHWFIQMAFPIGLGGIAYVWLLYAILKKIKNLWYTISLCIIGGGIISLGVYFLFALLFQIPMFPWGWVTFGSAVGLGGLILLAKYIRLRTNQ